MMGAESRSCAARIVLLVSVVVILSASVRAVVVSPRVSAGSSIGEARPAPCGVAHVRWLPPDGPVDWIPNRCEVVVNTRVFCPPEAAAAQPYVCIKP